MRQGDQRTGQVSAVDGGDVFWLERPQVTRVVPVEDVTAKPFELFQSRKGTLQPLDKVTCPDPAEIARSSDGKKIEADIGGRRAMRDDRIGIFLKIVGRQEIVFLADELFEEAPRPAGGETKDLRFIRPHRQFSGRSRRCTRPAGYERGQNPEDSKRQRDGPCTASRDRHSRADGGGKSEAGKDLRERAAWIAAILRSQLRCRNPFEQMTAGDDEAKQGASNRIDHEPRLVCQERQHERTLHEAQLDVASDATPITRSRNAAPP